MPWALSELAPRGLCPRRRVLSRAAFAVVAVIMALGCRGDGGGPTGLDPVIAGDWSGTAYAWTVRFDATFTQSGQTVGGFGHFSSPLASGDFTVTGTLVGTQVNLILNSAELGATAFRGKFTRADRIVGTFDPSGTYESALTLDRD